MPFFFVVHYQERARARVRLESLVRSFERHVYRSNASAYAPGRSRFFARVFRARSIRSPNEAIFIPRYTTGNRGKEKKKKKREHEYVAGVAATTCPFNDVADTLSMARLSREITRYRRRGRCGPAPWKAKVHNSRVRTTGVNAKSATEGALRRLAAALRSRSLSSASYTFRGSVSQTRNAASRASRDK